MQIELAVGEADHISIAWEMMSNHSSPNYIPKPEKNMFLVFEKNTDFGYQNYFPWKFLMSKDQNVI